MVKVTNDSVLKKVNKDMQIFSAIWQWKHHWNGHVLRYDGLLHEVIEGRMKVSQNEEEDYRCYMF